MISKISQNIIQKLIVSSKMTPDNNQIEIYIYGMECLLNTTVTLIILTIWAIITHTFFETYCWIFVFSLLRHHTGGLHAPTQFLCILNSSLLGISNSIFLKFIQYNIFLVLIICIACIIVCILYTPVDTLKYNLSFVKRKTEKYISILIIVVGGLISIVLKNSISISIMYSFTCVCALVLIKVETEKSKI